MPSILDRTRQVRDALKTTARFGKEIEAMDATARAAAHTDLLPTLETMIPIADLHVYNEKLRKWIDAHPRP